MVPRMRSGGDFSTFPTAAKGRYATQTAAASGGSVVRRVAAGEPFSMSGRLLHLLCGLLSVLPAAAGCHEPPPVAPRPSTPRRIVTIAPNAAEIIVALGESRRLVAVDKFCTWPDELAALPRVGGLFDPDLEAIVRLQPDLLILRGRNATLERLCADKNIAVYLDPTERLADIHTTIGRLGEMLGCASAAGKLQQRMRDRLDRIAAAIAGRPRPRVFITIARKPDSLADILTAGRGTFVDEIVTLAGGENVFAHVAMNYPQISLEAIVAAAPDVIIEAMPEAEPSDELLDGTPRLWQQLGPVPAVRNGRIFLLTDDHALIPSPRVVEIIAKIAGWLHPEVELD